VLVLAGQACLHPGSSCIADLSSCTFWHQNLLGSFCADTSSVDFQKEELNNDWLQSPGGGLAVRARLHFRNGSGDSGAVSGPFRHWRPCIPFHPIPLPSPLQRAYVVPFLGFLPIGGQETVRRRSASAAGTLQEPAAFKFEQPNLDSLHMQAGREERSTVQNDVGSSAFHPCQQENWGTTSSPFCPSALRILIRFFPPGIKWRLASRWLPPGLERANQHFSGCLQPHSADRLSKSPLDRARICPEKTHFVWSWPYHPLSMQVAASRTEIESMHKRTNPEDLERLRPQKNMVEQKVIRTLLLRHSIILQ
jgi:hypothetical protein